MKAVRQARSASPSSERRTPGAAAIYSDLFLRGRAPHPAKGSADRNNTDFYGKRLLKRH
jgi:hypothetical protein